MTTCKIESEIFNKSFLILLKIYIFFFYLNKISKVNNKFLNSTNIFFFFINNLLYTSIIIEFIYI
jgi:hypothetical protein